MRRTDLYESVLAERSDVFELLQEISDDEWWTPTLCAGWLVRDVVAHLLWDTISIPHYLAVAARYRRFDAMNEHYVRHARRLSIPELRNRFEATLDGGWVSRLDPASMLADLVIHHQDIRRPLGRTRLIEEGRLLHALSYPNRWANPNRFVRGLHWCATDVNWCTGKGPQVCGPGEALALAMVGRSAVLDELSGDGVPTLRERMSEL